MPFSGRPVAGNGFRFTVADLDDLDDRLVGQHLPMRMREPLVVGSHHAAAGTRVVDRSFELECIPLADGLRD